LEEFWKLPRATLAAEPVYTFIESKNSLFVLVERNFSCRNSIASIAMMVSEPPSPILRAVPKKRFGSRLRAAPAEYRGNFYHG
jgi:hypothetical protein